uniref:Uncharacterized protein n=1 Tax=Rhizophora mucronata TaxID=61149 RepID=A0A2P2NHV0_RHIMU
MVLVIQTSVQAIVAKVEMLAN